MSQNLKKTLFSPDVPTDIPPVTDECEISVKKNAFEETSLSFKFNHHGHKSGYDVTGDVFGELRHTETTYDGEQRAPGNSWSQGTYSHGKENKTFYKDGDICGPGNKTRRQSVITWACGTKLGKITKN